MKKKLSIILSILLCVCFLFAGCSGPLEMPQGDVTSNGGAVAIKGDYIYFANTYVDYTTLSGNDNQEKNVEHNAIFRIKTDEYGFTTKDDDGRIKDVEKVYSKIAGFNNSNMFIVGDYLYFTSPNIHKDKSGADKFDLTTLFRIKLDGSEFKEILTTESSQGKFYLATWNTPYLLIFDNNKVSKLELKNNLSAPTVLLNDVEDCVFPSQPGQITRLFYTKAVSEEESKVGITGNYLYKYNLALGESVQLGKPVENKITLVAFENNTLYYKLADEFGLALYYSSKLFDGFGADQVCWTIFGEQDGEDAISNFKVIDENNVVYNAQSKLYLSTKGEGESANYSILVDGDASIELVSGDYVYYKTESGVSRISYKDKVEQSVATLSDIQSGNMKVAGEYLYFYAKINASETGVYYMHRASIRTIALKEPTEKVECISSIIADELNSTEE